MRRRTRTTSSTDRTGSAARALGVLVLLVAVLTAAAPSVLRVHRGDTLSEIAQAHRTTVSRLIALNHLSGNGMIYAGQLLRIPATGPTVRPYAVRRGDTLTSLAARYGTTTGDITRRNHLRRSRLHVGQHLMIVVRRAQPARTVHVSRPVGRVAQSAAAHRHVLAARSHPSTAQVRRMVAASARRHHVDVSFALAVAYQESGFQQRVVSPVDAIGVMQVLPSTGRALDLAFGRHFDLLTAQDNIEAGVLLLQQLLRQTGNGDRALAGYYQGLGSIRSVGLLPQTGVYVRSIHALRARFRNG